MSKMQKEFEEYCKNNCLTNQCKRDTKDRYLCRIAWLQDQLTHTIPVSKLREWVEKRRKLIPKTKFNRKGFPVSHVACIRNATEKQLLKDLLSMLEE